MNHFPTTREEWLQPPNETSSDVIEEYVKENFIYINYNYYWDIENDEPVEFSDDDCSVDSEGYVQVDKKIADEQSLVEIISALIDDREELLNKIKELKSKN